MRTINIYNNTTKAYGVYLSELGDVIAVYDTEEEAREELEFWGDDAEVVRVNHK